MRVRRPHAIAAALARERTPAAHRASMTEKMWSAARCMRPGAPAPYLSPPCIVKVLPDDVWPYAKIVPFTPRSAPSTNSLQTPS